VPAGVVEMGNVGVSATVGDCKGDWTGTSSGDNSIRRGGSKGVVACIWSSSLSAFASSMLIDAGPDSFKLSSDFACAGEEHKRLSCLEMTLKAGLTSCDEAEFVRERFVFEWVIIDSLGLAPFLVFHFLEKEGNRVPILLATPETGESPDLRFLKDELAEKRMSVVSLSLTW
jgi:hypothetical protein